MLFTGELSALVKSTEAITLQYVITVIFNQQHFCECKNGGGPKFMQVVTVCCSLFVLWRREHTLVSMTDRNARCLLFSLFSLSLIPPFLFPLLIAFFFWVFPVLTILTVMFQFGHFRGLKGQKRTCDVQQAPKACSAQSHCADVLVFLCFCVYKWAKMMEECKNVVLQVFNECLWLTY